MYYLQKVCEIKRKLTIWKINYISHRQLYFYSLQWITVLFGNKKSHYGDKHETLEIEIDLLQNYVGSLC